MPDRVFAIAIETAPAKLTPALNQLLNSRAIDRRFKKNLERWEVSNAFAQKKGILMRTQPEFARVARAHIVMNPKGGDAVYDSIHLPQDGRDAEVLILDDMVHSWAWSLGEAFGQAHLVGFNLTSWLIPFLMRRGMFCSRPMHPLLPRPIDLSTAWTGDPRKPMSASDMATIFGIDKPKNAAEEALAAFAIYHRMKDYLPL